MSLLAQKLGAIAILVFLGIFTAVATCTGCQTAPSVVYPRDINAQHAETVAISALCVSADGHKVSMFQGSGMRLSGTQVLTAGHMAVEPEGSSCMWMGEQLNGNSILLMPDVVDKARDLATMRSITGKFTTEPLKVSIGATPEVGDTICEVSAIPYHIRRCGEVQLKHTDLPYYIHSTMIVEPGNSGSPVYNLRGELIGVTVALLTCGNGQICSSMTSAVDVAEIHKLMRLP